MSRVLIDASAAFDQRAGVGRYSRNIIDRLVSDAPGVAWTLFHVPAGRRGSMTDWRPRPPEGVRTIRYPLGRRRFDQLGGRLGLPLPVRPFAGPQDLVYSPDFVAPAIRGVERIITVHDLAFLTHSRLTTPGTAAFLRSAVEREVRRGAFIAAVSETTRDRIHRLLGVPQERIRVIANGVDRRFFEAVPLDRAARGRLGVPDDYLLMVGTIEPRKNHETVLRALRGRRRGLPLVIVGRIGWGTDHLLTEIVAMERAGRVVWLRDLDDGLLPALYAGAQGVLYPSWTEGFGLPVLEALAAGKPVVTGDDRVFAEVGGEFVTMTPPGDESAILEAIGRIERSASPEHLVAARRARAARYNWDQPAAKLRRWINDLTGSPGG